MKIKERNIFISGGSRGIGRAISLSQAEKGVTLFINYLRDDEAAARAKKEAEKKGARVFLLPGNVGDPDTILSLFKSIQEKTNRLDAVIHNAALGVFKPAHQLREKDWDISLDVNAKALLFLSQSALPLMKQHGGKIVAISSLGSTHFTPHYGAIGISKAALESLVRYLAVELAPYKIHVNAVSGGLIETDSLKRFPDFHKMKKEFLRRTPGGRLGSPEDIADAVSFLLGPKSDWFYGQTLIADGGYSLF
ncbi:MAG: enoyl-[acyl-carrier-protein] reductase FabL [Candidatus Omnitrophica bacterium CG07_land_8_20_14_0_80_50_8]|nr:MAG: enoyl-[acyl-carrier-protein] reductase FabL [Candidatus Omnitrophica bacterium CG07_land_8_20_14_0_80_50_8]